MNLSLKSKTYVSKVGWGTLGWLFLHHVLHHGSYCLHRLCVAVVFCILHHNNSYGHMTMDLGFKSQTNKRSPRSTLQGQQLHSYAMKASECN